MLSSPGTGVMLLGTVGYPMGWWHVVPGHGSASAGCFGAEVSGCWCGKARKGLEKGLRWAEPSPASTGCPLASQGGGGHLTFSADVFLCYLLF